MKTFLCLSILLVVQFVLPRCLLAQLTAGDDCSTATVITAGAVCVPENYTTSGATHSGLPAPSCGNFQGADVWFQVVVPASGHLQIKVQNVTSMTVCWAVYTGTCGALTELKCTQGYAYFNINDALLGGQTLFIRVWRLSSVVAGTFSICAWEPNTPVNDFCANAIAIPVGANCLPATYANIGCTAEAVAVSPNPTCGIYQGGDVWFTVVVPNSGHLRIEKKNVSGINAYSAFYTGSCGAFTQIVCQGTDDSYNINNINLAGQTLFIRVWNHNSGFDGGTFTLCAWEPNTPLNDSCAYATQLTVGASCSFSTFSSLGCTSEPVSVSPNPTCGIYLGGDAWFKVVVPSSGHLRIEKSNVTGISAQSAVYTGTCGAMTQLVCSGANLPFNLNNQNLAGQTLYIRVWNINNAFDGGTFNLCAWEPNTPANDSCMYAVPLTVGTSCNFTTYSNIGCTAEPASVSPAPSCGLYQGGDVWFTVVVPASGHLRIEKQNGVGINAQSAFYTGTCGSMTQIGCTAGNTSFNLHNHAMAGQTLFIRVWGQNAAFDGGGFSICAWEPNTSENDFCTNSIPLNVGTSCNPDTFKTVGCTAEATVVSPNPTCGFYNGGDLWFTVIVPSSGHLRIERTNISGINAQLALFSGTCGSMTQLQCAQNTGFINIHDHSMAGQTLYLRVWDYNNAMSDGIFRLCAWEPLTPENDFCSNATPLSVGFSCNPVTYTSLGCTAEANNVAASPSCGFYNGGDVWFTCIMPVTGLLTIEKTSTVGMNPQFAIYSGNCGALTQVGCSQLQNSFTLNNSALAGQTLYLRVWNYNQPDGGSFSLCLYDPTCLISINSVSPSPASCSIVNDGSLTVNASCTLCIGTLEYALNNGPYQSSPVFNGLASGFYLVKVRDSGKILCNDQWPSGVVVGAGIQAVTYYEDLDGDGYGKTAVHITTCSAPPPNYVTNLGDCNDGNSAIHPGATEIDCNNIDENCNGLADDKPVEINLVGNCHSISDHDLSAGSHDSTDFGNVTLLQSEIRTFTIENTGTDTMLVSTIGISGADSASFSVVNFIPGTSIPPDHYSTFGIAFSPVSVGMKNAVVTIVNTDCDESMYDIAVQGSGTSSIYSVLDLKLFLQGYYIGSGLMDHVLLNQGIVTCPTVTDTVEVELRDMSSLLPVASSKVLLQTDGFVHCRFADLNGYYYIVVRHRNSLQTWSALPVFISATPAFYDFSMASLSAFGTNVLEVESGVYAFYTGDINQDENVDLLDLGLLESDIIAFEFGYKEADINGDGNVDLLDNPLVESNISNFVFSVHP